MLKLGLTVCCLLVLVSARTVRADPVPEAVSERKPSPEAVEFFEAKVRPLLVKHCQECHGAEKQRGGLRLDSFEAAAKGTELGPAVVPGDLEKSLLIEAIRYDGDLQMPPKEKLPDEAIAVFTKWIQDGAAWPAGKPKLSAEVAADPAKHWAFQPVASPGIPNVGQAEWIADPLDAYVLARLEAAGISHGERAERRAWLRRVTFDLIGLPPRFDDVSQFLSDRSADAKAKVVDRLLESPQFGERWGRHWLDVARYADTKGYVFREDRNYPKAYTYRDWVVQALNRDMPYDQFLIQQLAADQSGLGELPEAYAAMGYLTLGRRFINNKHDIIDDRIDVVTRGLLGLSVTCARCHDHKFDPIPTADYYSLYGVFASCEEPNDEPGPLRLVDAEKPFDPRIFVRGNAANRGDAVPRQFLEVLSPAERKPFEKGSGRLELARNIASPGNPLTARVFVNRVWGELFGKGLVETPSDFGLRSDPPTHPELLDHLAGQFMKEGWSVKKLIRHIVLSNTYGQSSDDRPEAAKVDPENRLLWKMNRRRLDFEALRDALLAVSGELDPTPGGPATDLTSEPFTTRRTLYGFIDRQNLPGLFRTFDFASPDTHSPRRFTTTVPQQALFLMNSPFTMERAEHLAAALSADGSSDQTARIRALYQLVLGREPSDEEITLGVEFISQLPAPVESVNTTWQFGYGEFDEGAKQLKSFAPLPHWNGKSWQGGEKMPDDKLGWVSLHARGGHPGNNAAHAAVRRWIAPHQGIIHVNGTLEHPSDKGDGVRGRLVSSRTGLIQEWTAFHGKSETVAGPIEVEAGETLDFVTDCRTAPSFDSFLWGVKLRTEKAEEGRRQWSSVEEFTGPQPEPLGPWGIYAQVLMLSNEFIFLD